MELQERAERREGMGREKNEQGATISRGNSRAQAQATGLMEESMTKAEGANTRSCHRASLA